MDNALPLQVDQAGKKAEDLMKQHTGDALPDGQEPTTDLEGKLAKLQQKFDVLKGKYEAEIENVDLKDMQRLTSENALLKKQMTEMEKALASSNDLVKEVREQLDKKPEQQAETVDLGAILSDKDREHLKSEELEDKTLEIIAKIAQNAGMQNVASQLKEFAQKVETVEKRVETAENAQHQVSIQTAVPDFEKINAAPEFHAWLDKPANEFSPRKNREDLQAALSAGDFATVKLGIQAFKKDTGYGNNTGEEPRKEPPIEPDESIANDGDSIVGKQKTYSIAEVKQFYSDQTKGRWAGREKEAAAIDRDIVKAQSEGRIIQ